MKKIFELHQRITLMVNEYRVLEDTASGGQALIAFARQKRLAIREQFTLYTDETQTEVIASAKARTIIDLGAAYDVFDAQGEAVGTLKKQFTRSLLRSTWGIYGPHLSLLKFELIEKSRLIAIIRRIWEILWDYPFPIKYHFLIKDNKGEVVGEYIKITRFRDRYALYLEEESANSSDERVWMIAAVLLDAMQSR